jgi:hypothetical protein
MAKAKKTPRLPFRREEDDIISLWLSEEENKNLYKDNKSAASRLVSKILDSSNSSPLGVTRTDESVRKRMTVLVSRPPPRKLLLFILLNMYIYN